MLLHFLRWLRDHAPFQFDVLLLSGGPVEEAFREVAPTFVFRGNINWSRIERMLRRFGASRSATITRDLRLRLLLRRFRRYPLVYANTIISSRVIRQLRSPGTRVVTHVHELDYNFRYMLNSADRANLFAHTDHYIAVSEAVRRNLVDRYAIAPDRITLCHEFIASNELAMTDRQHATRIRKELGIRPGSLVVGGAGATTWRKGTDLFVALATLVRRRSSEPVDFVWVGGAPGTPEHDQIVYLIGTAGPDGAVHLISERPAAGEIMSIFDVFVLPSREDPLPLVCLEAAALGKPIVCFDRAGGTPELTGNDAGIVVPYLDVSAMADAVLSLLADPDRRHRMGNVGAARVRAQFDRDVLAPHLLNVIARFLPSDIRDL